MTDEQFGKFLDSGTAMGSSVEAMLMFGKVSGRLVDACITHSGDGSVLWDCTVEDGKGKRWFVNHRNLFPVRS